MKSEKKWQEKMKVVLYVTFFTNTSVCFQQVIGNKFQMKLFARIKIIDKLRKVRKEIIIKNENSFLCYILYNTSVCF